MVKVRFAPSPTGKLHLGSARTAVFNWLYAKHTGGKFVLRIEDTDKKRSNEEYIDSILEDMKWLGMDYDEFYRQSDRFDIYRQYVEKLLDDGKAYYCTCSKEDLIARNNARGIYDQATKYDGYCRGNQEKPEGPYVIRLNLGEDRDIIFKDHVRKRIRVNTKELDDFVLWKSDDSPTYNFAVVIDDALMEITHIIRGEDHITNTAKQLVLYDYLGFTPPEWAHLPLVFGKDKSPLSKRKGSTNIDRYRNEGFLPDALINYIARLGWSHGDDEIFELDKLIEYYDIDRLNKSNAVYDEEKMIWVNGKHFKITDSQRMIDYLTLFLEANELAPVGRMQDSDWLPQAVDTLKERNNTLAGLFDELKAYALPDYSIEEKARLKMDKFLSDSKVADAFNDASDLLTKIKDFSNLDGLEERLREIADQREVKFGALVQVLRVKLTGKSVSPDIISVIKLLGDEVVLRLGK